MKKVLFTHSYFLRFDPKQWKMQQPYPPLGTLSAAAFLKSKNYSVSLFDSMFAHSAEEIIPFLAKDQPDYLVIYDDGFNYLTKMCLTNMREAAFEMIQFAKARNIKVIVSSSDSTDHAEKYLSAGADFIIYGEGEETLGELIDHLSGSDLSPEFIAGLQYKNEKGIFKTAKRNVLKNIDDLPTPAWDLINMSKYKERWNAGSGYFSLNLSTTRGCPFHCNWCAKPIYGNRYNVHSPQRIVEQIKFLQSTYGASHFWMTDDIFGLKPGWIKEFADLIEASQLKIRFKIQSRADLLTNDNTISDLARAGCEIVWMGAESGSQKILDAMDKGITVKQIREATTGLKNAGVKAAFFLQFGYPGENKDDVNLTLKMVSELKPDDIGVSVSYPLPGTVFYESVKDKLGDKSNWEDSDELALMFNKDLPGNYYKILQRYVHRMFRVQQGKLSLSQMVNSPSTISGSKVRSSVLLPLHAIYKLVNGFKLGLMDKKRPI
ncbi:MAG: B12-binding domain-containing radical SAM protein [Bacteroidetes bacterium]|nr:B12-binding domain-containing radical SAM protein [Bacteroidota bacterium]